MTLNPEAKEMLHQMQDALHTAKQRDKALLQEIRDGAVDAYRAAMGLDFTPQGVIKASLFGYDITKHDPESRKTVSRWDVLSPEHRDILDALGAKHPQVVDKGKLASVTAEGLGEHLISKGIALSPEQSAELVPFMTAALQAYENAGVQFRNDVCVPHMQGLVPLVKYRDWLVRGGQYFMDLGYYTSELTITDNAIQAHQDILLEALVAAGDVKVNYGISGEIVSGIEKASIREEHFSAGSPFVVMYETKDGKKGEIDVLRASITSLTDEKIEEQAYHMFSEKVFPADRGVNIAVQEGIPAIVLGQCDNLRLEMRANIWRRHLQRYGVDFTKPAEIVLAHPIDMETVTFWYATKDWKGNDNGVMVGLMSNERYGHKSLFACPRAYMEEHDVSMARSVQERHDEKCILEPQSAAAYLEHGQRLTEGHA